MAETCKVCGETSDDLGCLRLECPHVFDQIKPLPAQGGGTIEARARALCHRLNDPDCTCEDVTKCDSGMAIMEALSAQGGGTGGARWRHRVRGTYYAELARASLQQSSQFGPVEGDAIVVYRGDDGKIWARAAAEFDDGRFEPAPLLSSPAPQPRVGREELREAIRRKLISAYGHAFAPVVDSLTGMALPASAGEVETEREACARIVEGRLYKERYREWPEYGPGNRHEDHETVKLTAALAAAIRARTPSEGKP